MSDPNKLIPPRTLKGFRDLLPAQMIPRESLIETARRVYRSYGFVPIETPTLEYEEILLGKGGGESDRQMFRFEDHGGRRVAMRFDLTVPFARFAAQHIGKLGTPFKRYHIGTVWRGENPQRGRYREFMQCDFDTIGTESLAADAETVLVAHDLLQALGIERFTVRLNNRKVLTGFLERQGLLDKTGPVLRALDKFDKVGADGVRKELLGAEAGLDESQAGGVLALAQVEGSLDEVLAQLTPLVEGSEVGALGVQELQEVLSQLRAAGVADQRLRIDVRIARGLDYYTGTILETVLDDLPGIGSVLSGGRYDDLASLYTKQRLPGIGASLGLDRLLAALEELGLAGEEKTTAAVFLPLFDPAQLGATQRVARELRAAGVGAEVFPEAKKLAQQLKYADKQGFRFAVLLGQQELDRGVCQLKDLAARSSDEVPLSSLTSELLGRMNVGGP